MSFVVTTVSPKMVVQVSDMRLSALKSKSVLTDAQRKSIVVMGRHVHCVLGWVGLATIGNHSTGDWVYKRLYEMDAVNLPLNEIVGNLTRLATIDFAKAPISRLSAADRRCHMVLGGWQKNSQQPQAFFGVIYNDLIFNPAKDQRPATLTPAAGAESEFLCTTGSFAPTKRPYHVLVIGDYAPKTLRPYVSGMKRLMKRRAGTKEISAASREMALEAARRSATISRNLISVEMEYRGGARFAYHPADAEEIMLMPDILGVDSTLINASIVPKVTAGEIKFELRGQSAKTG